MISTVFILIVLLFFVIVSPDSAAVNVAADAVNAWGPLINAHLHDILARVQEIALHDLCHGALVALAAA